MFSNVGRLHPTGLHEDVKPATGDARVPDYLSRYYWWAYVHPRAVKFFDRAWLVNLILLGQYKRLRQIVLEELDDGKAQSILQISCVYGDLSCRLARRLAKRGGRIDVADVLAVQLRNLRWKMPGRMPGRLLRMDSASLALPDASYDAVLLFFLLHEQPADHRLQTLAEAMRVLKPGGKLVIMDYAQPPRWNPLRYVWRLVWALFEPFAAELSLAEPAAWFAPGTRVERQPYFGGFYQKICVYKPGA